MADFPFQRRRPQSRSVRSRRPRSRQSSLRRAALVGGGWCWSQREAEAAEGAYRTAPVERGDIRVAISATGTLSAISTVDVGSQISGQVTDVLVDFNDRVKQGQVIARIDPEHLPGADRAGHGAGRQRAREPRPQAQATLRNAEADYTRKADLAQRQLVARSDVDLARAARDQARAQVAAAQAQIRSSRPRRRRPRSSTWTAR